MDDQQTFFDFAAEVGLTKHIGGIEATEKLIELCHIHEGKCVLDVGCGVGVTPVYIAKNHAARVIGVDISSKMIERSTERARKERMADRVEFRVADQQELPFDDDRFDAVITESVAAFADDKQAAVNEFARVTKPGGYVGLNETAWIKMSPPTEVVDWVSQDIGTNAQPQTPDIWQGLLENAGLQDVVTQTYQINVQDEAKGIFQRYGVWGMLRIYSRILALYVRSPAYRKFLKDVREQGMIPDNFKEYLGYGFFVGRK